VPGNSELVSFSTATVCY